MSKADRYLWTGLFFTCLWLLGLKIGDEALAWAAAMPMMILALLHFNEWRKGR